MDIPFTFLTFLPVSAGGLRDTSPMGLLPGFKTVRISGDSMSPFLNDGDWALFRTITVATPASSAKKQSKSRANLRALQGKVLLIQRRAFGFLTAQESAGAQASAATDFLQVKRLRRIDAPGTTEILEHKATQSSDSTSSASFSEDTVRIARNFAQGSAAFLSGELGLWVEGDNKAASTDSRNWGYLKPSEVVGVFVLCYKRAKSK